MAHVILPAMPDMQTQIAWMQQDARHDVSEGDLLALRASIPSPRALPKVPKIFLSNDCVFNCAYCDCRAGNECKTRYAVSPRHMAEITYRQAQNGRSGIFLTSAIYRSPDYTQELILQTLRELRETLLYRGYIHAKVMPGADPLLIAQTGRYANRLSVNIEVAQSAGYRALARNKSKANILTPMDEISRRIASARTDRSSHRPFFATSQTTQLMAGSTGEDDRTILRLAGALYARYGLSRVYYTAFEYLHTAKGYEDLPQVKTPAWRMHRLYQADRLMQQYGFTPGELAPQDDPFLSQALDPKAAWALRNLHLFPIEVNRADYELLLRVPGIGVTVARRILKARAQGAVTHAVLRALGARQHHARHFITCAGKYEGRTCENGDVLRPLLARPPEQLHMDALLLGPP